MQQIVSKIETKHWDIWDVKEWMGRDKVSTTDNYTKFAKKYYRNAPFDWIKTILKFHKKVEEENGKKSTNGQKRALLNKSTGEKTKGCSHRDLAVMGINPYGIFVNNYKRFYTFC